MGTTWEETVGSRSELLMTVLIETSPDGTAWELTAWDQRVIQYGNIEKAIEDWTGRWRVGEVTLKLADPDNSIYGSFTH